MAPQRGTKRAAPAAPAVAQVVDILKQHGVTKSNYNAIMQAIEHPLAGALPEDCRKMLAAMIPHGLCVPSDERHDHQKLAVDMIGEVVDNVQAGMQSAIDEEDALLSKVEASRATFDTQLQDAETGKAEATQEAESRKQVLAELSKAALSAKAAVTEAQELQRTGDAELLQATKDQDLLEAATQSFQKIKDGMWEAGQAKGLYDVVASILPKLSVDQSLVTALPSSAMKKSEERGQFDVMVLDQFEHALVSKVGELKATLEAGAPAMAERAAAVEKAEAGLESARAAQQEAADELRSAQECQRKATAEVKAAKEARNNYEPEYSKAIAVRDEKKTILESFKDFNVAVFQMLRDQISAKKRKQLKEAEKAAAAEAASEQAAAMEDEAAKAAAVDAAGPSSEVEATVAVAA